MLRHRRFLQVMHRLALMGALLMAVAPVVSRWVQSHQNAEPLRQLVALCTSRGMQLVAVGPALAHADQTLPVRMAGMDHADAAGHNDSMACDYCLLAARLLPFVLALLLLPLLQAATGRPPLHLLLPRLAIAWPAHAARGPPERLVA